MADVVLTADQTVARRPFTSPGLYARDLAILGYMLEDLRGFLTRMDDGAADDRPLRGHRVGRPGPETTSGGL